MRISRGIRRVENWTRRYLGGFQRTVLVLRLQSPSRPQNRGSRRTNLIQSNRRVTVPLDANTSTDRT
jgi:hypothetical protein